MNLIASYLRRWNAWQSKSVNRRIFVAMVTVGGLAMVVKLSVAMKDVFVAARFGTSDALDAYLTALVVPLFAMTIVCGAFTSAVVPALVHVHEHEGHAGAQRMFSKVMALGLTLLVGVTLLLEFTAGALFPAIAPRFSPEKLALTTHLFRCLSPMMLVGGLSMMWSAVLNAGERFALAAIAPAMTPLVPVAVLGVLGHRVDVEDLAFATACGYLVEASLVGWAVRRRGYTHRLSWWGDDLAIRQVINQYLPGIAASFMMGGTTIVDQMMAARLGGGSVSTLSFASKLVGFVLGLGSLSLSTAVLPHFSRMVARADWRGTRHTLRVYLRLVIAITVPLTIVLVLASVPIIKLVFQRGAFTSDDTLVVAHVQTFYLMQVPFALSGVLIVRLLSALRANHVMMIGAAINMCVNVFLDWLFMRWLGVAGIALSTAAVYALSFTFLSMMLYRLLPKPPVG